MLEWGGPMDLAMSLVTANFLLIASSVAAFVLFYIAARKQHEIQNTLLLIAGYVTYGLINWRHLLLLILITVITYCSARILLKSTKNSLVFYGTIASLAATLVGFRYFASLSSAAASIVVDGLSAHNLLPLGISFYTLQAVSYLIEVQAGRLEPGTLNHLALYLSFIFKLPAGPIERPSRFMEQLTNPRAVTAQHWNSGLWLIVLGLLEKKVMADNLAPLVRQVFSEPQAHAGLDIWVGSVAFAFQLFGDFSGYTNIARGAAMLLGFDLSINFRLPYFAESPNDFWSRWHITFSEWLRDYIFFPARRWLMSRKLKGPASVIIPTVLTMVISGLWHGIVINFVLWGLYFALISVTYFYVDKPSLAQRPYWLTWTLRCLRVFIMFGLVCIGWLIFRAEGVGNLVMIFSNLGLQTSQSTRNFLADLIFFAVPVISVNFFQAYTQNLLFMTRWPVLVRALAFAFILCWVLIFGANQSVEFIYARF